METSAADLVDWELAARLATGVPAGPRVPAATRRGVVELLRRGAEGAPEHLARATGLSAAARTVGRAPVLVVDRAGLIRATVQAAQALAGSVPAPGRQRGALVGAGPPAVLRRMGRRAASAQVAAAVGALSTRLLGQVLPSSPGARQPAAADSPPAGRMLLVAPNVLALQRLHRLDLADLAAWVALHESTHLLQLVAAPWLGEHLAGCARGVIACALARDAAGTRTEAERLAATTAFLEGHAETVLDEVGPTQLPSAHRLRALLDPAANRLVAPATTASGPVARLLRALDREGRRAEGVAFARAVVRRCGHQGLNLAWRSPRDLPRAGELVEPARWMLRMGL